MEQILSRPGFLRARWSGFLVGMAFWLYAGALLLSVRWAAHALLEGWSAHVGTMAGVAVGLWPWKQWLTPRVVACLGVLGRGLLVGCYFTCLIPFALLGRILADPFRRRRPMADSWWVPRRPLPNTLEAARGEF